MRPSNRRRMQQNAMTSTRLPSLLVLLALAGCATPAARPVKLPLPPEPVLVPVKADQVQCLAPDAYTDLVNRERTLRTWGQELQAIIKANNKQAAGN